MNNQGKDNEIVIPPRYETLGRSRPRPRNNQMPGQNNTSPPNYPSYMTSPGLMAFQRVPQSPQVRQQYQSPPQSRMSVMSTSGINYSNGTVGRQNTQTLYRQNSPALNGQVPRNINRNTRGINNISNSPGYYPVIPTRDISRQMSTSPSTSMYRHSPSSSVTSLKQISDTSFNNSYLTRSNTTANEMSFRNESSFRNEPSYRTHAPKNSISNLFTEEAKTIDEHVIPIRGKGSQSSLNSKGSNDSLNRSRSPSLPISEGSSGNSPHHVRSQSYTSLLANNMNSKVRSNSSGNIVTNSTNNIHNNSSLSNRQTKSEDNVMMKPSCLNGSTTPILGDNDQEYDSPNESPNINQNNSYSPNLSVVNENNISHSQSSNAYGASPMDGNKHEIVIPPRRQNYKTQSIYSNFSVMTTSGEVMEYSGVQNIDTSNLEEMLRNGAFASENSINHEIIAQPILEESSIMEESIIIPTRTSASKNRIASTISTELNDDSVKNISHNSTSNSISTNNSLSTTNDNSNNVSNDNIAEKEEEEEIGIIDHSALLSEIAKEIISSIPLMKQVKDSIEYTDCFTGADAVSTIASVIGTKNRKLAHAIGRSLASQSLFHDVLYTNDFIDSQENIYQLKIRSNIPYNRESKLDLSSIIGDYIKDDSFYSEHDIASPQQAGINSDKLINNQNDLPSGVFVAISSCYSKTCTKDSPCYSYTCPRRKAYNLKSSLKDSKPNLVQDSEDDNAWSNTVGKNVLEKVDDHERKRQEVIYEFIQSEKEYVDDLLSVIKLIKRPLMEGAVPKIEPKFVEVVFSNMEEIFSANAPFSSRLQYIQQQNSIVDRLGDVTLEFVKNFTCYIKYGEMQPLAKEVLQYKRNTSNSLEVFLKEMQSKKEFRRLPLESFLARPTTRLGRYPILIKDILKHTKEDHPDQKTLTCTMEIIQNILKQVNEKAGRTTNKIKLDQWARSLDQSTLEKVEEILTLKPTSNQRDLIREGTLLMKREGTNSPQEVDIVFLDNAFVITRKKVNTIEIIKKPIPVQLILLTDNEELDKLNNANLKFNEKRYSFTIQHKGVMKRTYTFMTKVYSEKKSWVETISERLKQIQYSCIEFFNIFECSMKINSAVVVKDDIMIFANEHGLFTNVGNLITMILPLPKITDIDIMPDAGLLFVLIDKEVIPYSIDALLKGDLVGNYKKPRKLCSGISFMKIGFCDGRHLLCAVKIANTNSTVRSYEPNKPLIDAISAKTIKKKVSTIDVLIPHKQFYIPAEAKSIQFLKRDLCIGCDKGFEVVNINTLTTQSLFDTHDPAYEWIIKAEYIPIKLIKTMRGDFIVCYNKVGFFLDKNGNPSRGNNRIFWMNPAKSFAYIAPYILAIGEEYVEVWDENNFDSVKQIIFGENIRLFTSYTGDAVYILSGSKTQLISRILLSRKRMA